MHKKKARLLFHTGITNKESEITLVSRIRFHKGAAALTGMLTEVKHCVRFCAVGSVNPVVIASN